MVVRKSFKSLTKTPRQISACQKAVVALEQADNAYVTFVEAQKDQKDASQKKRQKKAMPSERLWEKKALSAEAEHFMTYMDIIEIATTDLKEAVLANRATKRLTGEEGVHLILGHLLGDLSIPRQTKLIQHDALSALCRALGRMRPHIEAVLKHHPQAKLWELSMKDYRTAMRDLQTSAQRASIKTSHAIGVVVGLISIGLRPSHPSQGPRVRGWGDEREMLEYALLFIRDVTTHLVEEWKAEREAFLDIGERRQEVDFRRDRHKPNIKA